MSNSTNDDIALMLERAYRTSPTEVLGLLDLVVELLGARAARFHVADYSLRTLQHIDASGRVGGPQSIAGTLIGRVFTSGQIQVSEAQHTVLMVPLIDGSSRIGVLELDFDRWDGAVPELLEPLIAIFVMSWIVKGRYTDTAARDRVLFYTDGITEARSPDGSFFGDDRLADFLVRASLENLQVRETVRHLADNIILFSDDTLRDDATMLLMEYRPSPS